MTLKRKDLKKKIASLSALGAGALVLGAGTAEAGIVYSGPVNTRVGFGPLSVPFYSPFPGFGYSSAYFSFGRMSTGNSGSRTAHATLSIRAYGCGCLVLAEQLGQLQLFDHGAQWTNALIPGTSMLVGGRTLKFTVFTHTHTHTGTNGGVPFTSKTTTTTYKFGAKLIGSGPFNDKYALFNFEDQGNTLYGWIHLSYSVEAGTSFARRFGPTLTVIDWAYDDTGAPLTAGDAPEPSTVASTGLAALALGAMGLRKWRKTRKTA